MSVFLADVIIASYRVDTRSCCGIAKLINASRRFIESEMRHEIQSYIQDKVYIQTTVTFMTKLTIKPESIKVFTMRPD